MNFVINGWNLKEVKKWSYLFTNSFTNASIKVKKEIKNVKFFIFSDTISSTIKLEIYIKNLKKDIKVKIGKTPSFIQNKLEKTNIKKITSFITGVKISKVFSEKKWIVRGSYFLRVLKIVIVKKYNWNQTEYITRVIIETSGRGLSPKVFLKKSTKSTKNLLKSKC